jgi:hypothetical protein
MFDTIFGLPAHPLVVHGVVVLLPLMALVTVVVALRPRWREQLAWPVVVINALVLGMTVAAKQSGEAFVRQLGGVEVADHAAWGDRLPLVASGLLVVSVIVAIGRRSERIGPIAIVLSLIAAGLTVYWTLRTGHSGAVAVWGS